MGTSLDAPSGASPGASSDASPDLSRGEPRVEAEGGGPGAGGSAGVPAGDVLPDGSVSLIGHHQARHWRESTITDDDLSDRGGVFFTAVELTRMPMILTDPREPNNPIVFANKALLDLTGSEEAEVLGRNCRFLKARRPIARRCASSARRYVPVLLTTGYNEDLAQGTRRPGVDVLAKPYRRVELGDRVRSALAHANTNARRRRPSDFGAAEA